MPTESTVKEQYDRLAEIYDLRWHSYLTNTLTFLKNYLNLSGGEMILDIACGTGELERLLLEDFPHLRIIGVDISEKMLDIARSKLADRPNLEFLQASAIALPFQDHSFDLVVTASALHYFEPPVDSLKEMHRILKPNGKLIVMDWCRDYWVCQALDLFLKISDPAHKTCYSQRELRDFLSTSGFEIEDEHKQKFGMFWGIMVATGRSR
jgi:ubiquinone/menaquinone biosynthesis C-methylase UbiE